MPNTGRVAGTAAQGKSGWIAGGRTGTGLASASRAVGTANGTAFTVADAQEINARLNITDHNGGTLDASLQGSVDGTNWDTIGSWPQKSGANGTHSKVFGVRGYRQARWAWTVATAAVTFQIDQVEEFTR